MKIKLFRHLVDAVLTYYFAAKSFNIIGIAAENAGRFILLKDDFFPIHINFQSVLNLNIEGSAQFNRNNYSAKLVYLPDNTC